MLVFRFFLTVAFLFVLGLRSKRAARLIVIIAMAFVKRLAVENKRHKAAEVDVLLLNFASRLKETNLSLETRHKLSTGTAESRGDVDKARRIVDELQWLEDYFKDKVPDLVNSRNAVDFMLTRSIGNQRVQQARFDSHYGTRRIIQKGLFREEMVNLTRRNKIFCSQWLSDRKVIVGTKCNNVSNQTLWNVYRSPNVTFFTFR